MKPSRCPIVERTLLFIVEIKKTPLRSNQPNSKYCKRTIFHPKCKMNTISTNSCTTNWFFHIAPCNQCVVYKAPYSVKKEVSMNNTN